MVIDTSVFLAVLGNEPDRQALVDEIEAAAVRRMSAATLVEASMVVESRWGAEGVRYLDRLIETAGIEVVPVDLAQARIARQAFSDFGKGRHPAALNYGDCFVYALARQTGEPLLSKGNDFPRTDVGTIR